MLFCHYFGICFMQALEIEPNNTTGLVARSKCYLQIGDALLALQDAEASLSENKNFHKVCASLVFNLQFVNLYCL